MRIFVRCSLLLNIKRSQNRYIKVATELTYSDP